MRVFLPKCKVMQLVLALGFSTDVAHLGQFSFFCLKYPSQFFFLSIILMIFSHIVVRLNQMKITFGLQVSSVTQRLILV